MDDPLHLIAREEGVFLRREAIAAGYDDRGIARQVRAGNWFRVRHGAYCLRHFRDTLTPEERHLLLARAVLRTTPGKFAFSHVTALVAHGVAVWGVLLDRVHLTRLDHGSGRVERDVVHHVGGLDVPDLDLASGLTVTSPARSVIDYITIASVDAALCSADNALNLRRCTPDELRRQFERARHWPHIQKGHAVLDQMDGRAQSVGETRSRRVFRRQGLPTPVLQYPVYDADGQLIGIADFAWPERRVLGEFDGRRKYGRDLRPGERPEDAVFREKVREDLMREASGCVMGRIIWLDFEREDIIGRRFARLLRLAA